MLKRRTPDDEPGLPTASERFDSGTWFQPKERLNAAWQLWHDLEDEHRVGGPDTYAPPSFRDLMLKGVTMQEISQLFDIALSTQHDREGGAEDLKAAYEEIAASRDSEDAAHQAAMRARRRSGE